MSITPVHFQGAALVASIPRNDDTDWESKEHAALETAFAQVRAFEREDIPADVFSHLESPEDSDPIRHIGVVSGLDALPLKEENRLNQTNPFDYRLSKGKMDDRIGAAMDELSAALHAAAYEKTVQGISKDPKNEGVSLKIWNAFMELFPSSDRDFPHHR